MIELINEFKKTEEKLENKSIFLLQMKKKDGQKGVFNSTIDTIKIEEE